MDVVSLCPLRVASLVWRSSSGGYALTLIGKATFDLRAGELRLAEEQDDPNEDDNFWDDDPQRSVRSPSDLSPFKPRADVVLVGQAFAPGKVPVRSLLARLSVAGLDKTIEVCGDRAWTPDGGMREGPPFTSMALRYERAAGGPENPVGLRVEGRAGGQLPNLQIQGGAQGSVGFGPIAPSWPDRRDRLGRHGASFPPRSFADALVPDDLDASYFNVAPSDQQVDRLAAGDRLLLENLHPKHPRLITDLPRAWPRAFADRGGGLEEVSLTCDTLWIDTDRAVCTLAWRGHLGLHGPGDEGRVSVLLDRRPALSWAEIQRQCGSRSQHPLDDAGTAVDGYEPHREGTLEYVVKRREPSRSDGALPFVSNAGSEPLPAPRPAASTVPPGSSRRCRRPPPVLGGETIAPGALRLAPPPQPPPVMSAVLAAPAVLSTAKLVTAVPIAPVPEPAVPQPSGDARERPAAARAPGEVIDLIWFDPGTPDRVRIHLPWQELVARLRPVPDEPERDDDPLVDPPEVVDRGDVFGVITDADPTSLDDLDQCLAAATSPRGAFTPALALITGELELTFDEVKTLEATIAAVAPLSAGPDKKLKEAFDAAVEALASPFVQASGRANEVVAARLRDTFAQGSWSLPAGWLDQQVERTLVEQRRYQKRSLLGETWIRALVGPRGAAVPVYLPEALAGKLPLYARFPARLVVEVHLQQDQYETHPAALRCLALARVVPPRVAPKAPGKTAR